MGVVGRYNVYCIFEVQTNSPDGYGGEIQSFGYGYQEGTTYLVKGRLRPSTSDRVMVEQGAQQETAYNLEIRANTTWRPVKGMVVFINDGYRIFHCVIASIKNDDMKRKYWDLKLLEVE